MKECDTKLLIIIGSAGLSRLSNSSRQSSRQNSRQSSRWSSRQSSRWSSRQSSRSGTFGERGRETKESEYTQQLSYYGVCIHYSITVCIVDIFIVVYYKMCGRIRIGKEWGEGVSSRDRVVCSLWLHNRHHLTLLCILDSIVGLSTVPTDGVWENNFLWFFAG